MEMDGPASAFIDKTQRAMGSLFESRPASHKAEFSLGTSDALLTVSAIDEFRGQSYLILRD